MASMGPEFKVGLFTLLGLAATVFALFVLNPDMLSRKQTKTYYTELKDASGIMQKTQVKTNGVTIGKVQAVELLAAATKVTFEVSDDVVIPKGSVIEIRTVGFLGDKFIEIDRPEGVTETLPPGSQIPISPDAVGLDEVVSLVGDIAKDIKKVTASLSQVLGGESGERTMSEIIDNVREFTQNGRDILAENRADFREMIHNLQKTTAALKTAIGDREQDLGAIVSNIREFTTSLNEVLDQTNKERVGRILASFDDSMQEVKGATHNIKLISEKIERGEGTIGRLVNDDQVITDLESTLKDIRDVLAPVSKLQIGVDFHGELRADKTAQNYFNLKFQTRPDSYYLIGATNYPEEIVDTRTERIDTDPNDNESRTIERIKTRNVLRYNLQFAKRWHWLGVRVGIFESTGGFATDLYAFSDRFRFTFEAFDFVNKTSEERRLAHLKAYASALFFNHVYAMVGVDDPTRLDPDTTRVDKRIYPFVGAGVTFNDQDLKVLFGAAALAR